MGRKIKYTLEFKLRCIEEVLNQHYTIGSVASVHRFDESNLRKWIGFYKKYGTDGLLPRKNRIYDVAFKLKVLHCIDKEFLSLRQACVKFNIPSDSVIIKWQRTYASDGPAGLTGKPKARPTMTFKRAKKKSDKPLNKGRRTFKGESSLKGGKRAAKKVQCLNSSKRIAAREKAQAIMELRPVFDLEVLLNQTSMARSSYYYHEKKQQSTDKHDTVKRADQTNIPSSQRSLWLQARHFRFTKQRNCNQP